MTEERRKYLASISKEERVIRLELSIQKNRLRYLKELIKYPINTNDKRTMLRLMQDTRFIIKALKKRIPQKLVYDNERYHWGWNCPACGYRMLNDLGFKLNIDQCHCPRCGQETR